MAQTISFLCTVVLAGIVGITFLPQLNELVLIGNINSLFLLLSITVVGKVNFAISPDLYAFSCFTAIVYPLVINFLWGLLWSLLELINPHEGVYSYNAKSRYGEFNKEEIER